MTGEKSLSKNSSLKVKEIPSLPASGGLTLPGIEGKSFKAIMKELEGAVIEAGMQRYGSMAELARHFQVDRSTIFRKVRELEHARKERA